MSTTEINIALYKILSLKLLKEASLWTVPSPRLKINFKYENIIVD